MIFEINSLVCLLVALSGSSQTRDHGSALPRVLSTSHTGRSSSPHAEVPWTEALKQTHRPAGRDEISAHTTAFTKTKETVDSQTNAITTTSAVATSLPTFVPDVTTAPPATPTTSEDLSSAPTVQRTTSPRVLSTVDRALLTGDPLTTYSRQPAHTEQDTRAALNASTFEPQSELLTTVNRAQPTTTEYPLTSAAGWSPAEPTRLEVPSQLNVGDEDIKPRLHSSSPLDPLLAGLLSVFIIATAIILIVLLLKFRQRTNHPEFHRLQDLPMDDLLEDTPLSRYTY